MQIQNFAKLLWLRVFYLPNLFSRRIIKLQQSTQTKYKTRKQEAGGDEYYRMLQRFTNSYFPQVIQESDPIEKKTLANRSKFSLIRRNKIVILCFMTFAMNLVMMSDKRGMLWCLVMLSFMSLSLDLIMMSNKKGGLCLALWGRK